MDGNPTDADTELLASAFHALPEISAARVAPEQWRDIPGYEGSYQVSDQGRVRSLTRSWTQLSPSGTPHTHTMNGRVLRPGPMASGHLSVVLGRCGGSHQIHALVLKAFVGPPPAGMEVRHLDGNEQNNRLSNLEYGTRSRNVLDTKWHKGRRGDLQAADIRAIKQRLELGGPHGYQSKIAKEFGVKNSTISAIKSGRTHRDVLL